MKLLNKLKNDRQDLISNLLDNIESLEKLAFEQQAEIEQWKEEANKYQTMWCEAMKGEQAIKDGEKKEYITSLSALNDLLEVKDNAIKKLRAEVEGLNIRKKALTDITKNYDWKFAKAKSEAIKEFTEEYKDHIKSFAGMFSPQLGFAVSLDAVINAVNFVCEKMTKEMVGDDNA